MSVYFIKCTVTGLIKIGVAESPAQRLLSLQTGSPGKLEILATCDGSQKEEADLHRKFQHLHERGEWFRPDGELFDHISELTGKPPPGRDWMIAWTPTGRHYNFARPGTAETKGKIAFGSWPADDGWHKSFAYSGGCCFRSFRRAKTIDYALLVMCFFNTVVVRDGISPESAHEAFLNVPEYRKRISPDIPGANG